MDGNALPDLSQLPPRFDAPAVGHVGAIGTLTRSGGRPAHYIDEGYPGWRSIVFFGGLGTSVGAFYLTEFARSLRLLLRLRAISVERNGFGRTPFDPALGYADAADDVLAVLDALRVERFGVVAFSGGGPHAAALAARSPARVISLHLAAAAAGALPLGRRAGWEFPARSPVHRIPGFVRAAGDEGRHALGRDARGEARAHEWRLLCGEPLPDLSGVPAPAYLYWGTDDDVVPPAHAHAWQRALPNVVVTRAYPGEGHDVQYRHWDQILVDAALPDSKTMICRDGRVSLIPDGAASGHVAAGATLGLCGWTVAA